MGFKEPGVHMINTNHTSSVHCGVTGNSYFSAETTFILLLIIIYGGADKKMTMKHKYILLRFVAKPSKGRESQYYACAMIFLRHGC